MGSRVLERSGHRVIAYDARGHGRSAPAPDHGGVRLRAPRARPAGGARRARHRARRARRRLDGRAHAPRFALDHPERVAALGLITPAYDPTAATTGPERSPAGTRSRAGCARAGWRGSSRPMTSRPCPAPGGRPSRRCCASACRPHEHPDAVADALEVVPRSRPFEDIEELSGIAAPTLVVASRDEADPGHPLAVGERYAQAIPGATAARGGRPARRRSPGRAAALESAAGLAPRLRRD